MNRSLGASDDNDAQCSSRGAMTATILKSIHTPKQKRPGDEPRPFSLRQKMGQVLHVAWIHGIARVLIADPLAGCAHPAQFIGGSLFGRLLFVASCLGVSLPRHCFQTPMPVSGSAIKARHQGDLSLPVGACE